MCGTTTAMSKEEICSHDVDQISQEEKDTQEIIELEQKLAEDDPDLARIIADDSFSVFSDDDHYDEASDFPHHSDY